MRKRRTHEDFLKEVDLAGKEYEVIGEYKNTLTKIKMVHISSRCNNHKYEVTPKHFFRGVRCPKCNSGSKKKSQNQFVKEVYNLVGKEYSVIGVYSGSQRKIKFNIIIVAVKTLNLKWLPVILQEDKDVKSVAV